MQLKGIGEIVELIAGICGGVVLGLLIALPTAYFILGLTIIW